MSWLPFPLIFLSILALPTACVTRQVVKQDEGPYAVRELGKWRVMQQGAVLGHLVLLRIEAPEQPAHYYRAQNGAGGWVGYVTTDGRMFKLEPFQDEPRDLGLYPMKAGLALLYEVEGLIEVLPMPGQGEPTEANALRSMRAAWKEAN